jgi:hypothetical protein
VTPQEATVHLLRAATRAPTVSEVLLRPSGNGWDCRIVGRDGSAIIVESESLLIALITSAYRLVSGCPDPHVDFSELKRAIATADAARTAGSRIHGTTGANAPHFCFWCGTVAPPAPSTCPGCGRPLEGNAQERSLRELGLQAAGYGLRLVVQVLPAEPGQPRVGR